VAVLHSNLGAVARYDESLRLPPNQIARTISVGVPGEMPSFEKRFTHAQIGDIAAFVKSLPPTGK